MIKFAQMATHFLLIAASLGLARIAEPAEGTPTPSPTPCPTPEISLELYFRRPAKILAGPEGENFEIVEERSFLNLEDVSSVKVIPLKEHCILRAQLTPDGILKLDEASTGNIGRTVILALNGVVRKTFEMELRSDKTRIFLAGNFSRSEAEMIAARFNDQATPTPAPRSSPSPAPRSSPSPASRSSPIPASITIF